MSQLRSFLQTSGLTEDFVTAKLDANGNITELEICAHDDYDPVPDFDEQALTLLQELSLLDISCDGLNSFGFLKELKKLKALRLDLSQQTSSLDIKDLSEQLELLSLTDVVVVNTESLSKLTNLNHLLFENCRYTLDIRSLLPCKSLEFFGMHAGTLLHIEELASFPALEALSLSNMQTGPLDWISSLKLISLTLNHVQLQDIEIVRSQIMLSSLSISGNQVSSLQPLEGLSELQYLNASHNRILNSGPLASLPELEHLLINDNQLTNLDGLVQLTVLKRVWAQNNHINQVKPFVRGSQLEMLNISDNKQESLEPFAHCTLMQHFMVYNNPLNDLSALSKMKQLQLVYIDTNRSLTIEELNKLRLNKTVDGQLRSQMNALNPESSSQSRPFVKQYWLERWDVRIVLTILLFAGILSLKQCQ